MQVTHKILHDTHTHISQVHAMLFAASMYSLVFRLVPLSHDAIVALWKPKLLILLHEARYFGNRNSVECTINVASPHQILRG